MNENGEVTNLSKSRSENWMDVILNSITALQYYEDLMNLGATDIVDYFQEKSLNIDFVEVQIMNLQYFNNECKKLMINSYGILGEDIKKEIEDLLKELSNLYKTENGFTFSKRIQNNLKQNFLKPSFYEARNKCTKIREKFIKGLWKILSPSSSDISNKTYR